MFSVEVPRLNTTNKYVIYIIYNTKYCTASKSTDHRTNFKGSNKALDIWEWLICGCGQLERFYCMYLCVCVNYIKTGLMLYGIVFVC